MGTYTLEMPAGRRAFVWREDEKAARDVAEKLRMLGFDALLDPSGPAVELVRLRYGFPGAYDAQVDRVVLRRELPAHPAEAHNAVADFLAGFLAGFDYLCAAASGRAR